MSLLKQITSDESIANETDRLGGGGAVESGAYKSTIEIAYLTIAASEAVGVVIVAKTDEGKQLRETLWVTSGKDKGRKNYYEKDGVKSYLPGYLVANSIALLAAGKELSELDTESKTINVYNKDAKKEVPTKVDMLMDLVGKEVIFGVIKEVVDKTTKSGNDYVATGETREQNVIDKVFRASDRLTTAEIRAQATEAAFIDAWNTRNAGQTRNKAKGASGTAGAPKPAGAGAAASSKPKTSLFAN